MLHDNVAVAQLNTLQRYIKANGLALHGNNYPGSSAETTCTVLYCLSTRCRQAPNRI